MPRADDFAAFDHSLPQWPAAMQADVVHGAVRTIHVRYADGLRSARKFFGFVRGRKFGSCRQLREVRHNEISIVPEEKACHPERSEESWSLPEPSLQSAQAETRIPRFARDDNEVG